VLFALGAAGAFVLVSVSFLGRFHRSPLDEGDQVLTLSGGFDFLSVAVTVAVAYGLARLPEPWAFPVTGLGTVGVPAGGRARCGARPGAGEIHLVRTAARGAGGRVRRAGEMGRARRLGE
jgi:hypothetical protein